MGIPDFQTRSSVGSRVHGLCGGRTEERLQSEAPYWQYDARLEDGEIRGVPVADPGKNGCGC